MARVEVADLGGNEWAEKFAGYVDYVWGRGRTGEELLEVWSLGADQTLGNPRCVAYAPVGDVVEAASDMVERARGGATVYVGCVGLRPDSEFLSGGGGGRRKGRGKRADRGTVVWAWGDIDLALEGGVREGKGGSRGRFCSSVEEGLAVIEWAGLPEPTFVVFSGSGLYPGWVLRRGEGVAAGSGDAGFVRWMGLRMSDAAAERGIHVDLVGDMTRVLRPVGSVNWKGGLFGARRVSGLEWSGREYSVEELGWDPAGAAAREMRESVSGDGDAGVGSAGDVFSGVRWDIILGSVLWEKVGEGRWRRPGALSASSCAVYPDAPGWLVVFSDAVGLPCGVGGLNKWRTWCWLWFGGDSRAAEADLMAAARGLEAHAPWPDVVVSNWQQILHQSANFSAALPPKLKK